jgi:hypothetical protein
MEKVGPSYRIVDSAEAGAMAFFRCSFECGAGVTVTRVSHQDDLLFAGTSDGRLCMFNLSSGTKLADIQLQD